MKEYKSKIVQQAKPPRKMFVMKKKRITEFTPGKCLICGLGYDVLTYVHAEKHGYKSPEEMIKDGVVVALGEVEED